MTEFWFFDIDGTLLLTGGAGARSFMHTFAEDFGVPSLSDEVLFAGRSDRAIAMDLFTLHGIDPSEENWQRFASGYLGRLKSAIPDTRGGILPGVQELLDRLDAQTHVVLGLITGNLQRGAEEKLKWYGLHEYFRCGGYGDTHVDRSQIAREALEDGLRHAQECELDTSHQPPRIVVVGDTPNDVRCARAIGAVAVAVATGTKSMEELSSEEPDLVLEDLSDHAWVESIFD